MDSEGTFHFRKNFSVQTFQNGPARPGHQRKPRGCGGSVRPFFGQQALTVAEAFGHPADFSIAVFPVKGVMALATPQLCVFQAAADIAVIPESEIIQHLIHPGRKNLAGPGFSAEPSANRMMPEKSLISKPRQYRNTGLKRSSSTTCPETMLLYLFFLMPYVVIITSCRVLTVPVPVRSKESSSLHDQLPEAI